MRAESSTVREESDCEGESMRVESDCERRVDCEGESY